MAYQLFDSLRRDCVYVRIALCCLMFYSLNQMQTLWFFSAVQLQLARELSPYPDTDALVLQTWINLLEELYTCLSGILSLVRWQRQTVFEKFREPVKAVDGSERCAGIDERHSV